MLKSFFVDSVPNLDMFEDDTYLFGSSMGFSGANFQERINSLFNEYAINNWDRFRGTNTHWMPIIQAQAYQGRVGTDDSSCIDNTYDPESGFRWPTREELRLQAFMALACGARGISAFTMSTQYCEKVFIVGLLNWAHNGKLNPSEVGNPNGKYTNYDGLPYDHIALLYSQLQTWGSYFLPLWVDEHYARVDSGYVPDSSQIIREVSGNYIAGSTFTDTSRYENTRYFMLVNRVTSDSNAYGHPAPPQYVTVKFRMPISSAYVVKDMFYGKEWIFTEPDTTIGGYNYYTFSDSIPAGDGILYRVTPDRNGAITANTTFYDLEVISSDFSIPQNLTLDINAGSRVYVLPDANRNIVVSGTLHVTGSGSDSVLITSLNEYSGTPDYGDWLDIHFNQKSTGLFTYTNIRYAYNGIDVEDSATVTFNHGSIRHCEGNGIYNYAGFLTVHKSQVGDIVLKGIDAYNAKSAVDSSTFMDCQRYGIYINGHHAGTYDSSVVLNCSISRIYGYVPDSAQYGIYINGNDKVRLQADHISNYVQGGIRIESAKPKLQSDTVSSCTYYGAYLTQNSDPAFYGCKFDSLGGGIYAYDYSDPYIRSGCRFRNISSGNGIAVYADNYCNPFIRQTEFYNVTIGIEAKGNSLPNIGQTSGGRPDSGLCDFENCTNYYIYYVPSGRDTCLAQGNYFGPIGPNVNKFSGLIKYIPYKVADPFTKKAIIDDIPTVFGLNPNYPNPFNPQTAISFNLIEPALTKVLIYNVLGQKIKTLVNEYLSPGQYSYIWDGRNELGIEAASGVYLYRIESGSFIQTKKMTLIR